MLSRVRRAQQILVDTLTKHYHRDCPRDKLQARKRITFLKSLRLKGLTEKRTLPQPAAAQPNIYIRSRPKTPSQCLATLPEGQSLETTPADDAWKGKSILSHANATENSTRGDLSCYRSGSKAIATPPNYDQRSATENKILCHEDRDRQSFMSGSTSKSKIRALLRRDSYSSSMASEMWSLLRMRLSMSSLTTGSELSFYTDSIPEKQPDLFDFSARVRRALKTQRNKMENVNTEVIDTCCSQNVDCTHRLIKDVIVSGTPASTFARNLQLDCLQDCKSNIMFFAAMSGAPADVIMALLCRACYNTINSTNPDGQTFLFYLDPAGFQDVSCTCYASPWQSKFPSSPYTWIQRGPHSSKFDCLVRHLEQERFNFDQVDHEGRHFLSFLCASPEFNLEWLTLIMSNSLEWDHRIRALSQLRDSSGCFLIDYIAVHPRFGELSEATISRFRPRFRQGPSSRVMSRALASELETGETALHTVLESNCLAHQRILLYLNNPEYRNDINKYDCLGRTPLMRYLNQAIKDLVAEESIVATVRMLIPWGVNLDARSRGGSTMLHFAAKSALPELIELALDKAANVDHRDCKGFTALDYAAKMFDRSRNGKSPPELTARSLKSTMRLLDYATNRLRKPGPVARRSHNAVIQLLRNGAQPTDNITPQLKDAISTMQFQAPPTQLALPFKDSSSQLETDDYISNLPKTTETYYRIGA